MLRETGESLAFPERVRPVQALVYIFIGLASLAFGVLCYFGLTFTPVESMLSAIVFGCVSVVITERTVRARADLAIEAQIEHLSRLLSTDAQAGSMLGQRINALASVDAGKRLEGIEADISVLGTVIRQVAEAVADIEVQRKPDAPAVVVPRGVAPVVVATEPRDDLAMGLQDVRQAIADERLVFHVQPIVTLPQRRSFGYDLQPRIEIERGQWVDSAQFLPRRGGDDLARLIEGRALIEAVAVGRRGRANGQALTLFLPLSRATLSDKPAADQMLVTLEANRAVVENLVFVIAEAEWNDLTALEEAIVQVIVKKGAALSLTHISTLRMDVAALAEKGIGTIHIDAQRFLQHTAELTDYHTSDVANYLARFGIDMVATGITTEQQIVTLLEDGVKLAQGPRIAGAGPIRADLLVSRTGPLKVAQV